MIQNRAVLHTPLPQLGHGFSTGLLNTSLPIAIRGTLLYMAVYQISIYHSYCITHSAILPSSSKLIVAI